MEYTVAELEQERWKPIFGYDGMYEVSDLGRVRSKHSGEWKVRRANKVGSGYLSITLSKDGKKNMCIVHRLVARYFIENDNIFNTEVNHINEDKTDNRASNLEWCDRQYNNTYNDIHHRRTVNRNTPKHYNCKRSKLKDIYNPDISIAENIELFRENGIECSRDTVWKLRKDLNLKGRSNWKRNEIKDLYNPNLSIKENLKVFKENCVECSYNTVMRLKKDLGLIKK